MTKIDTILKLADLGYSRVEIEQLMATEEKPAEPEMIDILDKKDTEKPEEHIGNIGVTTKPELFDPNAKMIEEPASKPEEKVDPYAGRLESIESTLKAIQAQNVRWSSMPESAAKPKTELEIVQEILGGIKSNGNE